MNRRTLVILVVGWLLGMLTALMTPTLVYQQQSLQMVPGAATTQLDEALASGWFVTRRDDTIITLERPRFRLP